MDSGPTSARVAVLTGWDYTWKLIMLIACAVSPGDCGPFHCMWSIPASTTAREGVRPISGRRGKCRMDISPTSIPVVVFAGLNAFDQK